MWDRSDFICYSLSVKRLTDYYWQVELFVFASNSVTSLPNNLLTMSFTKVFFFTYLGSVLSLSSISSIVFQNETCKCNCLVKFVCSQLSCNGKNHFHLNYWIRLIEIAHNKILINTNILLVALKTHRPVNSLTLVSLFHYKPNFSVTSEIINFN